MIKKRLEHAVFLMGMLFITLLTSSANAFAQDTHKVIFNGTNVTMSPADGNAIPQTTLEFQLTAETGYNLPTTITVNNGSDLIQGIETSQYTYNTGKITLGSTVDMTTDLTITAVGVAKDVATLATFTYSVTGGLQNQTVTGFTPDNFNASGYTVDLGAYQAGTTAVTLTGTETAESGATVEPTDGTGTIKDGASIKVTAKNLTTQTYSVTFTVAKAKILTVTEPLAKTLTKLYTSFDDAKVEMPLNLTITAEDGTTSLPLAWTIKTAPYNPASGATNTFVWTATVPGTLDATDVSVTGEVIVTNFTTPLSTDNKLSALTYLVPAGTETPVTGFKPEDTGAKEYAVELPSTTSPTAEITVAATAAAGATFKVGDATGTSPFTVALANGEKDFVLTVIAESGAERIVTIKFTTAKSIDNSLTTLTYTAGTTTEDVTGFKPEDTGTKTYTVNTIPFGTKTVSVKATAAQGATVKDGLAAVSPFTVTLNGTTVVPLVLTVTSESGVARTVTINFSAVQDKITSVTPPVAPTLDKKLATAAEVIALLPTMLAITTEGESVTELPLTWALKTNTTFTDVSGEINIFTWTATPLTLNVNNQALTGDMNVINALVPETGDKTDVTVSAPAVQFGDGSTKTTVETLTVSAAVKELGFDQVTVSEEVIVLVNSVTNISLKGTNDIKKITNNGTLTLKNATTATSSSIATKANTGAVKAVENNGTFTDLTGTITEVTSTTGADLEITTLPKSQLDVTTATAELSIVASTGATYQWMKGTATATGTSTAATLTVAKADQGSYTCVVKNANNTVTLVTPPVTVSFQTTTPPVNPPTPTTYTVSLPAVTGATFSKAVTTQVTEGGTFEFKITLDKDYDQSVPVVKINRNNNEVITPVDSVYTVSDVRGNLTVTVTGITKNIPTGIDDVNSGTRIWAAGSTLHIFTEATENVYVFNASGVLQKQFRTPGGDYTTQMNEGLYIVKIGNYTQKVIIK